MPLDTSGNFWAVRPDDGQSRSHIPPQPLWVFFIRIAQFLLAIIIVGLTGYAADAMNAKYLELALGSNGLTFSFFVFAWTVLFLGWLVASILLFPTVYSYWAHLAVEGLVVIFWLACWAVLASNASKLGKSLDAYDEASDYYKDIQNPYLKNLKSTTNCVRAAAALGALEWILFVTTLVFFVMSLLQHRKTEAGQGPVAEPKLESATEMAPAQQQPYAPQGQQYQQPYPQQPYPQQPYPQQPYPQQQQVYPQQN